MRTINCLALFCTSLLTLLYCENQPKKTETQTSEIIISSHTQQPNFIGEETIEERFDENEIPDTNYVCGEQADIWIQMDSLPIELNVGYIKRDKLFLVDDSTCRAVKMPIPGKIFNFAWTADTAIIFGVKQEIPGTKSYDSGDYQLTLSEQDEYPQYNILLYKWELKKSKQATYIATLFDRSCRATKELWGFFTYDDPAPLYLSQSGDTLTIPCESYLYEGFVSCYKVLMKHRRVFYRTYNSFSSATHDHKRFSNHNNFRIECQDESISLHYGNNESEYKTIFSVSNYLIFNEMSYFFDWKEAITDGYFPVKLNFSPDSTNILFAPFIELEMGRCTGSTFLVGLNDSLGIQVASEAVIGCSGSAFSWISPNRPALLHENELYVVAKDGKRRYVYKPVAAYHSLYE